MRKKRVIALQEHSQTANFYNNIASAWFIGSVINPFFLSNAITLQIIFRATIGLMLAYGFLLLSKMYESI